MAKKLKKPTEADIQCQREAQVAAAMAAIKKKYGSDAIIDMSGTGAVPTFDAQIPSGCPGIDLAVGAFRRQEGGVWEVGLPPRRVVEIFGREGSGKTTLLGHLIANAQARHPNLRTAIIDTEHALDPTYFRRIGVDWGRCDLSQPTSGEEALQVMELYVKTGGYSLVCLDSIAMLKTEAMVKGDIGDQHVAQVARLMSPAMSKITAELSSPLVQTTLVFTNQTRSKIGPFGGTTTPGGEAMRFAASFRIKLWKRESAVIKAENDEVVGHITDGEMIKNKVAPPYKKFQIPIIFGVGIDAEMNVFDIAKERGVISASGAWYSLGDLRLGNGRENCIRAMRQDPALRYRVYNALFADDLAKRGYHPDLSPIEGFVDTHEPVQAHLDHFAPVADSEYEEPEDPEGATGAQAG